MPKIKSISFPNWKPIRKAIEEAYQALGRDKPHTIPVDEWNLVGTAINEYDEAKKEECVSCNSKLTRFETIRCLDCKAPFCELCAPAHFWPKGRPAPVDA